MSLDLLQFRWVCEFLHVLKYIYHNLNNILNKIYIWRCGHKEELLVELFGVLQVLLFEKSRLVRRPEGEPTFHIFYQLLAGVEAQLR